MVRPGSVDCRWRKLRLRRTVMLDIFVLSFYIPRNEVIKQTLFSHGSISRFKNRRLRRREKIHPLDTKIEKITWFAPKNRETWWNFSTFSQFFQGSSLFSFTPRGSFWPEYIRLFIDPTMATCNLTNYMNGWVRCHSSSIMEASRLK